jgi:hypothetical protein
MQEEDSSRGIDGATLIIQECRLGLVSLAPVFYSSTPHPQLSCGRLPPALRQLWMWGDETYREQ